MQYIPVFLIVVAARLGVAAYGQYQRRSRSAPSGPAATGQDRQEALRQQALRDEAATLFEQFEDASKRGDAAGAAAYARLAGDRFEAAGNHYRALGLYHIALRCEEKHVQAAAVVRQRLEFLPAGRFEYLRALHFLWQGTELNLAGHFTDAYASSIQAIQALEAGNTEALAELGDAAVDTSLRKQTVVGVRSEFEVSYRAAFRIAEDASHIERVARFPAQGCIIYRQAAHLGAICRRLDDAEAHAIRAAEVSNTPAEHASAIDALALVRTYQGRNQEALALREQLLQRDKPSSLVWTLAAGTLSSLGRWDEAADYYTKSLALCGDMNLRQNRHQRALREVGLATVRMEQGRVLEATELLQATLGVYPPDHRITTLTRGYLLRIAATVGAEAADTIRQPAEALLAQIDAAAAALPIPFDGAHAFHDSTQNVAIVFFELGDAERGLELLDRYGEEDLAPGMLPKHYYWCGRCLESMGDPGRAWAEYGRAVECGADGRHVALAYEAMERLRGFPK
jgi:tetratricopeptide (TPR) repeat protein